VNTPWKRLIEFTAVGVVIECILNKKIEVWAGMRCLQFHDSYYPSSQGNGPRNIELIREDNMYTYQWHVIPLFGEEGKLDSLFYARVS
jgi:hypothetical protein